MQTRSTLNRNGVTVTSGLYDSGYEGHIAGMIHNTSFETILEPHMSIAQFIMADAMSAKMYAGGYNHKKDELPEQLK